MPLYEYKCHSCGDVFEIIQKFSDQPLTVHENCGGAVERLISTSALQFKGSGWYVNDYGKGNSKAPKPGSNGEGKGAEGKGSEGKSSEGKGAGSSDSSSKSDSGGKTESSTKSESTTSKTPAASKSDSK